MDYYVIPLNTQKESLLVASDLRNQGYKVEYELMNKKLGKALEKANKENIPNVIIIGEDEVRNNRITIKNMDTGEERFESFQFDIK
ncbi:His/Gly/Thr/Pro-type tRNA ligase C-terminal domain-containing protein [Pseudalkalibacillus sp. R45]|uniref:His/Gly/Thr/Pro-type tRNA ligase C-terminal domain-containing protein n=1 Tax=Pseudalkalibacillus sp. R45 TaxID=3457433 RepID=UPI003FCE1EDC